MDTREMIATVSHSAAVSVVSLDSSAAMNAAVLDGKLARLRVLIRELESVVIAYSGGVDSTLVLKVAHDELGERAIGVTAVSPSLPSGEREEAGEMARCIGARWVTIETAEVDDPRYQANTEARCYFCKTEVYGELIAYARAQGFAHVVDGLNTDDLTDRRPGRRAAEEHGVRSPLAEVALSKAEVREISRRLNLPTWDKPSLACLSSRIPYGIPVTREVLVQIDRAEQVVRRLGIRQVRVRHHGRLARIEVQAGDLAALVAHRETIARALHELGYLYVTIDLDGYRMGSLNEAALRELLNAVSSGAITTDEALAHLRDWPYENLGYARIDHHRTLRKGAPEVVFCEGKTPEQAAEIFARLVGQNGRAMATRASEAHANAIRERLLAAQYHPQGRVVIASGATPLSEDCRSFILVATGGTADLPVAEEAALTIEFNGRRAERLYDVGVAGVHRLLDQRTLLAGAAVVVAVAGMDGALPGVIAGLVACPVIAVPTSVGYGTGLGGVAALMNMLNACAPGIAVVNIDNGFGAGYLASIIARQRVQIAT